MHYITNNAISNRDSTLILTYLVGVYPRNIHTKFEANLFFGFRDEVTNGILHTDI